MATGYPVVIDTVANLPTVVDNITALNGSSINILRDTIIRIEQTLGVVPQGVYTTVRARLDAMEAQITGGGGGGSVTFAGDLSGTSASQTVIGWQGSAVSSTAPADAQIMIWNSGTSKWTPTTLTGGITITDTGTATATVTAGKGPVFPRTLSNRGAAAAASSPAAYGSIYSTAPSGLNSLVYDNSTFTSASGTTFGPFVWGSRQNAADIFRYDLTNALFDVVPLNDIADGATAPIIDNVSGNSAVIVANDGSAWTIEVNSQTLVQINHEAPYVIATYAIPGGLKNQIAYDSTNNAIILLGGNIGSPANIARFTLSNTTFSADVSVGNQASETVMTVFVIGGFVFVGSELNATTHMMLYKLNLTTLATISQLNMNSGSSPIYPTGYAYLSGKLFITTGGSNDVYRITVSSMTQDTRYSVSGASNLCGMALNPNDNSLWITDSAITGPSVVFQLTSILSSMTLSNTYVISTTVGANTNNIVWNSSDGYFVVSSPNLDEIYILSTGGSVSRTSDLCGLYTPITPFSAGTYITSGPGTSPTISNAGAGGIYEVLYNAVDGSSNVLAPSWVSALVLAPVAVNIGNSPYTIGTSAWPPPNIILCNTSGGVLTINFPSTPAGNTVPMVIISDDGNSAATHHITIAGNGNNVESIATPGTFGATATIQTNSQTVCFYWTSVHWKRLF